MVPSITSDAYPVTITFDIDFDSGLVLGTGFQGEVMMGTCDGTMSQAVTFAPSSVIVNKEVEPWFTIPADTDLYSFGQGGKCGGSLVVSLSSSPLTFTGLNTSTRVVEFYDTPTLPTSFTITIDATWTYALGTVNDQMTVSFTT